MIVIDIMDEASPTIKFLAVNKPVWMRKIMKSTGWYMQAEIKAGMKTASPGGVPYRRFFNYKLRARLEEARGISNSALNALEKIDNDKLRKRAADRLEKLRFTNRSYKPMGRLQQAIGYQFDKNTDTLKVGWLSNSAKRLGNIQQEGLTRPMTEKMKRYFFAAGIPVKKSTVDIPARKTIDPMALYFRGKLGTYMDAKLQEYIANGGPQGTSAKRKYRVVG